MTDSKKPRTDVYEKVTARIVAALEQGTKPWLRPWRKLQSTFSVTLPLRHNGTPYKGINILLLWEAQQANQYPTSRWLTYNQAVALGGQVRRGEHGHLVVFANRLKRTQEGDDGQTVEREIPFLKGYTVFNVSQIDGLPTGFSSESDVAVEPKHPALIETAEAFIAATGAVIRHGGDQAFYAPGRDFIQLPQQAAFFDAEHYTATKAHELTHWTGHPSRCAREFGKRFGDQAYAFEELVAELGSAFLCAGLGIEPAERDDHAAYVSEWLKVLKHDKRAIFTAAAQAQRAVDFLHELQPALPN